VALAVVHVIGALGASFAFGLALLMVAGWEQNRLRQRRLQDASIAIGVPVSALERDESLAAKLIEYSSTRFSAELLRNRISDLCGVLQIGWGWTSWLLQVGIVAAAGWATLTKAPADAVYMWFAPAVAGFFWVAGLGFSFTCLLLTGRYPGEAKAARKSLAWFIEQRAGGVGDGSIQKSEAASSPWPWVAGGTVAIAAVLLVNHLTQRTAPVGETQPSPAAPSWQAPGPAVADLSNLRDSVVTAMKPAAPPVPQFSDIDGRLAYLRWLGAMSHRLQTRMPEWETRREFIQTLWYESRRAGLDPGLVLGVIETTSGFRKFYVSDTDSRGYMSVAGAWSSKIGDGDVSKLFDLQTNLRFGCVLLRLFLDQRSGHLDLALQDYYAANLSPGAEAFMGASFAERVMANGQHWMYLDPAPVTHSSKRSAAGG
jgi:soluble lytic murein transglycosylase-like protein